MSRIASIFLILAVLALGFPANAAQGQTSVVDPVPCPYLAPADTLHLLPDVIESGDLNGSKYCVWAPPGWNGEKLVIFAHGYVDPTTPQLRPPGYIPTDQLALTDPNTGATVALPNVVMSMGYALAVPGYSKNGLAVVQGVQAVRDLGMHFSSAKEIYVVGASEGGLVTAYALEAHTMVLSATPDVYIPFKAGVATCGPVGDFVRQINYWGDFRVAYDYYFPHQTLGPELPTSPISIDPSTIAGWGIYDPTHPSLAGLLLQKVTAALQANPGQALKLVASGKAPFDPANLNKTVAATTLGILDYSVKATDDGRATLSGNPEAYKTDNLGNPYGNTGRWVGLWTDFSLNSWIKAGNDQFKADPAALDTILDSYETSGKLTVPLVTLHTTGDPIVPYWHELLYIFKVWRAGSGLKLISIPIPRYGHCAFTPKEAIFAFALAVFRATGQIPTMPTVSTSAGEPVLTLPEFNTMRGQYDTNPPEPNFYFLPSINK